MSVKMLITISRRDASKLSLSTLASNLRNVSVPSYLVSRVAYPLVFSLMRYFNAACFFLMNHIISSELAFKNN